MSRRAGSSWRSPSAWLWAPVLLFFLWSVLPAGVFANSKIELRQRMESLRRRLLSISALTEILESESANWKGLSQENGQRANELLSELAEMRRELEIWRTASGELSRQLQDLKALQAQSEAKLQEFLETSRRSSDSWRAALEGSRQELRRAKTQGFLWAGLAALLGAGIGYGLSRARR